MGDRGEDVRRVIRGAADAAPLGDSYFATANVMLLVLPTPTLNVMVLLPR